jgi:hypothetical protein
MVEETLQVAIADLPSQQLELVVQGDAARSIVLGQAEFDFEDEQERMPDFAAVFAAAANLGFFGDPQFEPSRCRAQIIETASRPEWNALAWLMNIENLPLSALRILLNMSRNNNFERITLRTKRPAEGEFSVTDAELTQTSYPAAFRPLHFEIKYLKTSKSSKDRLARITFVEPPPDRVIESSYRALDVWTNVIAFGGYAKPDQHPTTSGALPELAFLLDDVTIEQSFPEAFLCAEEAFHGLLNWTHCIDKIQPVARVEIQ